MRIARVAIGAALYFSASALAQGPAPMHRLCMLDATGRTEEQYFIAFNNKLRDLGFVEGRNLIIERRSAGGRPEKLDVLAADLAKLNCHVLVAPGNESVLIALERQTSQTPIVVVAVDYDPQATGHVASLAHPEGRITGVSAIQSVLPAKRLELLMEAVPGSRRIAVLSDESSTGQLQVVRAAATHSNVQLEVFDFESAPYDYPTAFAQVTKRKADGLLVLGSANFVPARPLIAKLAIEHHLPSMFHHSVWAEAGGLISYGPNFSDVFARAAEQVALILGGKKPSEIPLAQPTKFELVVNMKTARALNVTIPPAFLARADRIID